MQRETSNYRESQEKADKIFNVNAWLCEKMEVWANSQKARDIYHVMWSNYKEYCSIKRKEVIEHYSSSVKFIENDFFLGEKMILIKRWWMITFVFKDDEWLHEMLYIELVRHNKLTKLIRNFN